MMNRLVAFIVMLVAVVPLPLISRIQHHQPLSISPGFIGEFIGLAGGVMVVGTVIGSICWIFVRGVMGQERAPAAHYFFAGATIIIAAILLIGNVGCLTSPGRCN